MPPPRKVYQRDLTLRYAITIVLISAGIGLGMVLWTGMSLYHGWLIGVNGVMLLLFRLDKRWSQRSGAGRIPNRVLIGGLLAGGVAGGFVGMHLPPRHKTQKGGYWAGLLVGFAIHASLSIFLMQ
jgi:uncharacterized membrane protein YsdA (DUF1294 family)